MVQDLWQSVCGWCGREFLVCAPCGRVRRCCSEQCTALAACESQRRARRKHQATPEGQVGYRILFGQWYTDASGGLGYAWRVASSVEDLSGGTAASGYRVDDKSSFYGTASLDLGLYF